MGSNEDFKGVEENIDALEKKIGQWDQTVKSLEEELRHTQVMPKAIADFQSLVETLSTRWQESEQHIEEVKVSLAALSAYLSNGQIERIVTDLQGIKQAQATLEQHVVATDLAQSGIGQHLKNINDKLASIMPLIPMVESFSEDTRVALASHSLAIKQVQHVIEELERLQRQQAASDDRIATIAVWVEEQKAVKRWDRKPREPRQKKEKKLFHSRVLSAIKRLVS